MDDLNCKLLQVKIAELHKGRKFCLTFQIDYILSKQFVNSYQTSPRTCSLSKLAFILIYKFYLKSCITDILCYHMVPVIK